ncbi:MAG: amino acid ABC transporter ATP-binding protein [Candidatus Izemoplasmatales bacterium]
MNLEIKGLSHQYDLEVLKNLNLSIKNYHSVAIIGVSGSGKSTLLRILAGMENPTKGDISINNLHVQEDEYRNHIGFVFQSHNLFPHLTLKRNITLVLEKTRNIPKLEADNIASKYLAMLHLETQMNKLPRNVSGGQAQRASIARALSINPNIIFLDEPTASLDPILSYEVLQAVKELKGLGKEFIFVTHVMSFVRDFADYVVFIDEGEIIEQGEVSILDHPKHPSFKQFMDMVK